jgi:hypothetical protein
VTYPCFPSGGDVAGPGSSLNGDIPLFNGTSGKVLKDSGVNLSTFTMCANILSYGGVGDGATDNTAALTAAFAAQPGRTCVQFPPGRFKFATPFTHIYSGATYESVTIQGAGQDVTEIIGPNNQSAFTFSLNGAFNAIHLKDFSLTTPSPCGSCTGIALNQLASPLLAPADTAQSDVTNVSMYGTDRDPTGGSNYWGSHIVVTGLSMINFQNVYLQGIDANENLAQVGISLVGISINQPPVVYNLSNVTANMMAIGLNVGCYVQGVTVNQSNFVGNKWGIYVAPGCDFSSPQVQLTVSNSQINSLYGIYLNAVIDDFLIANNLIIIGDGGSQFGSVFYGVVVGANAQFGTITGNLFNGASPITTNGIDLLGTLGKGGIITGNQFQNMTNGIVFNTGVTGWTVGANHYYSNTLNIGDNTAYGNFIQTEVSGAAPTLGTGSSDCGTSPSVSGRTTDASGTVLVGTSPGVKCTVTFSAPFVDLPRCFANNPTALARPVTAIFANTTSFQIAANSGSLTAGDTLQYHCEGYQ